MYVNLVVSKRWEELVSAMGMIGFAEEEIGAIKRIIAAILHLGNVQFTSKGDDECQVKNAEVLGRVATLLRYTLFSFFCLLSRIF